MPSMLPTQADELAHGSTCPSVGARVGVALFNNRQVWLEFRVSGLAEGVGTHLLTFVSLLP